MGNSDGVRRQGKIVIILEGRGRWKIPAVCEDGVNAEEGANGKFRRCAKTG